MKRFLIVLVVVAACVVGLGFYMQWFRIGSDSADGNSNVTLSVDTDKFKEDSKTAVSKVKQVGRRARDKVAGSKSMDGTVVSVGGDKLTMTGKDDKEHSHMLADNVKVTCDGKVCKAADLKAGMKVRVTTEKSEPHAATRIEALDNNQDFEKGA